MSQSPISGFTKRMPTLRAVLMSMVVLTLLFVLAADAQATGMSRSQNSCCGPVGCS